MSKKANAHIDGIASQAYKMAGSAMFLIIRE
jgi:hypothetical protein